ncbi:MAG TPA: hypothetical protein PLB55_19920, partial [Prosthecobacter sp.]|nr:hypothetical protein [Prosthecobacter sp.]
PDKNKRPFQGLSLLRPDPSSLSDLNQSERLRQCGGRWWWRMFKLCSPSWMSLKSDSGLCFLTSGSLQAAF